LTIDNRKAERILVVKQPATKLQVKFNDKSLDVDTIMDVSPFGAGILLSEPIAQGTSACLIYGQLKIFGSVTWTMVITPDNNQAANLSSNWIGIYFDPADMKSNMLFFKTMTEYPAGMS